MYAIVVETQLKVIIYRVILAATKKTLQDKFIYGYVTLNSSFVLGRATSPEV